MTLILALTCPVDVVQVTDRLLTDLSVNKPFDAMANKNLIYRARDAVVAIGYTGHAYINKVPTDNWMAARLQGISPLAGAEPPMGISVGAKASTPWLDIGQSVELLRTELNKALGVDSRRSFELVIVGWKIGRKGRWTPVLWSLEYDSTSKELETIRSPRDRYMPKWQLIGAPQVNISSELLRNVMAKVKQSGSVDKIEGVLVDCVREVSSRNSAVGPNCTSIQLPHPYRSRIVKASYCPVSPGQAIIYTDQWSRIVPAAYSPWILGPGIAVPPAIVGGQGRLRFGLKSFEVQLCGPESPGGPLAFFGSQDRKKLR